MDTMDKGIGKRLRDLRLQKKKTLKEESEALGVSLNSIWRWENGLSVPRGPWMEKIASIYGVTVEWLLYGRLRQEDVLTENGTPYPEGNIEQQLLKMCKKLSDGNKYKILGYMERLCVEDMDDAVGSNSHLILINNARRSDMENM